MLRRCFPILAQSSDAAIARQWLVSLTHAPKSSSQGLATGALNFNAFPAPSDVLGARGVKSLRTELQKPMRDTGLPTITEGRQAFEGDLRSTSALGLGDGIADHTGKWLQAKVKTPMDMIRETPPIKCKGLKVASRGGDDPSLPALGCPIEWIDLRGTTPERPAVCKYTGNKYYSDDWIGGGGH